MTKTQETSTLSDYDRTLISAEQRVPRETRLLRTGIPRRFWDLSWDDYHDVDVTSVMRTALIDYGARFIDKPRMHAGKGFLLQGSAGLGKTMAAAILGVQLSDDALMVRFTTMAHYLDTVIRQFTLAQSWQKYENLDAHTEWVAADEELRRMRDVAHLLIIDDAGKEHHTASRFAVDSFDSLLRHRYDIGRPVGLTSNYPIEEWNVKYSASMESFLYESCLIRASLFAVEKRT